MFSLRTLRTLREASVFLFRRECLTLRSLRSQRGDPEFGARHGEAIRVWLHRGRLDWLPLRTLRTMREAFSFVHKPISAIRAGEKQGTRIGSSLLQIGHPYGVLSRTPSLARHSHRPSPARETAEAVQRFTTSAATLLKQGVNERPAICRQAHPSTSLPAALINTPLQWCAQAQAGILNRFLTALLSRLPLSRKFATVVLEFLPII